MSVGYKAVQWNRHKKVYDLVLAAGAILYLVIFIALGVLLFPAPNDISPPILLMRALGTLGILLLHIILAIGPLARFDARFAPLLYNRRHLGVTFFLIALLHALVAIGFYGAFGNRDPLSALLAYPADYLSISAFPFEAFGFVALLIFFLMAATSHDFWLNNLSPRIWKSLHMLVYVAYALVVLHVALGALQSERSILYPILLLIGATTIGGLHLAAGWREVRRDASAATAPASAGGWIDAGPALDIPDSRARIICPSGARTDSIAVFRDGDRISAVANRCAHQGGPLGEGQIIDGCITCPWHGYQYLPASGQSPPPFTEKIPTHRVRITRGRVEVDPNPLPPGTPVEPARIGQEAAS